MTILVTGGAGFIGSAFCRLLLKKHPQQRLVCVDALTYAADLRALEPAMQSPDFAFYREDVRNREGIFAIFEKERPDAVVNFAAQTHVDRSIEDPGIFLETNILGTQVLMDACLKFGTERFHQVSTDEVYGELPLDRPELSFREDAPLRAGSPYSCSKASADLLALAYRRTYGLPVTISRCSNNYGPYQYPEKLIPLMICRAMQNRPLPVYGQGRNVRDWLYVDDHCEAILTILERGRPGEVYNVGAGCEKSNIEIVRILLRELGKPEDLITFVADRRGHDLRYSVDAGKLRRELGWQPKTCFADGIRSTVRWYREQAVLQNEMTTEKP